MLEGVDAEMMEAEETEEMGQDLLVSVVCQKIYEEPELCGSAADFLFGEEMEGDPPGREEVEAGAQPLKINDNNKCHCLFSSIESSPAVNDDKAEADIPNIGEQDLADDVDLLVDVNLAGDNSQDFDLAIVNVNLAVDNSQDNGVVEDDILPAEVTKKAKKMPKTKKKFGRGVIRGSDRKQGRGCGHISDRQAQTDVATTTFARGHVPSVMCNLPVKYMTKAQLSKCLTTSEVRSLPLFFNLDVIASHHFNFPFLI